MGSEPSSCDAMALKAAPTVVCARTSLAVTPVTTRANRRGASALRPHATSRARELVARGAHARREGLAQHAPPVGGASRGRARDEGRRGLRCFAGPAAAQVATLAAAGGAKVAVVDGDARNSTRTDSRAAPTTVRLHRDVSIPRRARNRYVATGRSRVRDRGNEQRRSVSLERTKRSRRARAPGHPCGVFPADRHGGDQHSLHRRQRRRLRSDRLEDGPYCTRPASCDARAA